VPLFLSRLVPPENLASFLSPSWGVVVRFQRGGAVSVFGTFALAELQGRTPTSPLVLELTLSIRSPRLLEGVIKLTFVVAPFLRPRGSFCFFTFLLIWLLFQSANFGGCSSPPEVASSNFPLFSLLGLWEEFRGLDCILPSDASFAAFFVPGLFDHSSPLPLLRLVPAFGRFFSLLVVFSLLYYVIRGFF